LMGRLGQVSARAAVATSGNKAPSRARRVN